MFSLAQIPPVVTPIVIPTLDGLTVVMAAFWFYCLARPERVLKKQQFWLVFYVLLLLVVFYTLRLMLYTSAAGQIIVGIAVGLLHIVGLVLTVMYVGGLGGRDIADELSDAAHAFQHGGEPRKPKIVPITGQMPRQKESDDAPPPRIVIDLPKTPGDDKGSSLPLE
jgi:hypothetical protein